MPRSAPGNQGHFVGSRQTDLVPGNSQSEHQEEVRALICVRATLAGWQPEFIIAVETQTGMPLKA